MSFPLSGFCRPGYPRARLAPTRSARFLRTPYADEHGLEVLTGPPSEVDLGRAEGAQPPIRLPAMPLSHDQRNLIRGIFAKFLDQRVRSLERLTLDHLKFNVVALRAIATMLELNTPEALLRYRLAQHLERSLVTAMGTALQAVAKVIAGQGSGVAGADIEKIRDGRRYFVQIKSGPDTANKDIAQNIAALLNSARVRDPEAICLLGVCYGRPDQISGIAHREMQARGVGLLIGREFWEFIGDDPATMADVLELAGVAAAELEAGDETYGDRVERKLAELIEEFKRRYGDELNEDAWTRFLSDNS
jgi:type II restriction endonuclease EcoO109I-like protein